MPVALALTWSIGMYQPTRCSSVRGPARSMAADGVLEVFVGTDKASHHVFVPDPLGELAYPVIHLGAAGGALQEMLIVGQDACCFLFRAGGECQRNGVSAGSGSKLLQPVIFAAWIGGSPKQTAVDRVDPAFVVVAGVLIELETR